MRIDILTPPKTDKLMGARALVRLAHKGILWACEFTGTTLDSDVAAWVARGLTLPIDTPEDGEKVALALTRTMCRVLAKSNPPGLLILRMGVDNQPVAEYLPDAQGDAGARA